MNNQSIMFAVIGLLIGAFATWTITMPQKPATQGQSHSNNQSMMQSEKGMSMSQMLDGMKGKTGDEFDKAFIIGMIEHHNGAIDMAKEAQTNSNREEIKNLANEIISAQAKEIEMMQKWQKDWGFTQ